MVEVRRNVRAFVLIFSLGGVADHCGTLVRDPWAILKSRVSRESTRLFSRDRQPSS